MEKFTSPGTELELSEEQATQLAEQLEKDKQEFEAVCQRHKVSTVFKLSVPLDDNYNNFTHAWLKKPSRTAVSLGISLEDRDPLGAKEIVLRNAWLEGDEKILTDDDLFLSASTQVDQLIGIRMSTLKKNSLNTQ